MSNRTTRRRFLSQAGSGIIAASALPLLGRLPSAGAAVTTDNRGYVAGHYGLELDGIDAGWLRLVEGGHAAADVVTEKLGGDASRQKHIGAVKYEDIAMRFGTGMSRAFYDWIKEFFDGKTSRKNGAILTADFDYNIKSRLEWQNGLITQVAFPALDAASKDAAAMTVTISPETTRMVPGGGTAGSAARPAVQKRWLPSDFRLAIDGLDPACTRVNKIEAITIKQKVVQNPAGNTRDTEPALAGIEVPNLVITFPEADAQSFYTWHQDFVAKGNNGPANHKQGTLQYLTPDLREVLFTLTFSQLAIFKITPDKVEAAARSIRRVKAEMYCEAIKFEYGPSALA